MNPRLRRALMSVPRIATAVARFRWQTSSLAKGQAAYRAYKDAQRREYDAKQRRKDRDASGIYRGSK